MLTRLPFLFLVWIVAAALSALAAVASVGALPMNRSPGLAASLWPTGGAARGALVDRAVRGQSLGGSGRGPGVVEDTHAELARSALSVEPAWTPALRALALHHDKEGRRDEARRLMRVAAAITKRDLAANLWLIDDYGRSGDVNRALSIYDHILRTVGDGQGAILAMMTAALADPAAVEPLFRLLRTRPPWAESFWHAAAQMPGALGNAGRLRVLLARSGIGVSAEKDAMLLNALAERQLFDDGRRIHTAIVPKGAGNGPITNGDFSRVPALAPYDWQLTSTGELGAGVNQQAGLLEISALGATKGEVARQLVRLEPGRYSIDAEHEVRTGAGSGEIRLELVCAEGEPARNRLRTAPLAGPAARLDVAGETCRNYWLIVAIATGANSSGFEAAVDRLQLRRS